MNIVGFSGKAGTGKDYHAQQLVERYGFRHMSFADQLKMQCIAEGLCTYEEAYHTKPAHIRTLLQIRGTEEGWQKYGARMWTRAVLDGWCKLYAERYEEDRFVFSDVRFVHEVNAIEEKGGIVIRLVAPNRHADKKLTDEQEFHISETALDDWAFQHVVRNDPGDHAERRIKLIVSDYLFP